MPPDAGAAERQLRRDASGIDVDWETDLLGQPFRQDKAIGEPILLAATCAWMLRVESFSLPRDQRLA
jgi:hypothetical protein